MKLLILFNNIPHVSSHQKLPIFKCKNPTIAKSIFWGTNPKNRNSILKLRSKKRTQHECKTMKFWGENLGNINNRKLLQLNSDSMLSKIFPPFLKHSEIIMIPLFLQQKFCELTQHANSLTVRLNSMRNKLQQIYWRQEQQQILTRHSRSAPILTCDNETLVGH